MLIKKILSLFSLLLTGAAHKHFHFQFISKIMEEKEKKCYEEIIKALCEFMVIKLISVKMRILLHGVDV